MPKPELRLVSSQPTVKRSDRVINLARVAKDNQQRLKANHRGGFFFQPTSPDAA